MEAGRNYTVTVTNAPASAEVKLQFQHIDDTWYDYPGFTETANADGTVVAEFICISTNMRLKFSSDPGTIVVSAVAHTRGTF